MNREACKLPDAMITSSAPALAILPFLLLVPYNKQLNNLDCSVVTGKSQTSAYRIDLANLLGSLRSYYGDVGDNVD